MSDALRKPTPEELSAFEKTTNTYLAELEDFFRPKIEVAGEAEPTANGDNIQSACLAMASMLGNLAGQLEASMPPTATEQERLDLMRAVIMTLATQRGMTLTMLNAPDYIERIQIITSSQAGRRPDNLGLTNQPAEPTGGQNAHPYLH